VLLRIFASVSSVPIAPPSTPPLMSKMLLSIVARAGVLAALNPPRTIPAPKYRRVVVGDQVPAHEGLHAARTSVDV